MHLETKSGSYSVNRSHSTNTANEEQGRHDGFDQPGVTEVHAESYFEDQDGNKHEEGNKDNKQPQEYGIQE